VYRTPNVFMTITIQFLEKPTKRQLLLSWREPGRCNYTEQLWALRKARRAATCALSGERIRPGDQVYSPVGQPVNYGKYIRADAVQLP
jgi:hypothetical protein